MTNIDLSQGGNTLDDCRQVLRLHINGQATLLEANLRLWRQWLWRLRCGGVIRCRRRWHATPGWAWRCSLRINVSLQIQEDQEAQQAATPYGFLPVPPHCLLLPQQRPPHQPSTASQHSVLRNSGIRQEALSRHGHLLHVPMSARRLWALDISSYHMVCYNVIMAYLMYHWKVSTYFQGGWYAKR